MSVVVRMCVRMRATVCPRDICPVCASAGLTGLRLG